MLLRQIFARNPALAERLQNLTSTQGAHPAGQAQSALIAALVAAYGGEPSRMLNFVGPAGRLPAIGFQWADRVPWLGDGLVDAAFRLESNEWNGHSTLQARLCALSPHAAGCHASRGS